MVNIPREMPDLTPQQRFARAEYDASGALGGGLLAVQGFLLFHAGALGLSTAMGGALATGV